MQTYRHLGTPVFPGPKPALISWMGRETEVWGLEAQDSEEKRNCPKTCGGARNEEKNRKREGSGAPLRKPSPNLQTEQKEGPDRPLELPDLLSKVPWPCLKKETGAWPPAQTVAGHSENPQSWHSTSVLTIINIPTLVLSVGAASSILPN